MATRTNQYAHVADGFRLSRQRRLVRPVPQRQRVRQILICGVVLLVPRAVFADVTISNDATSEMVCASGVCSPTAADAVLNVNDLENLLASGNVELTTTGSGVQANNIEVTAALAWSSTNTLALDAYQSIAIDQPISVAGVSGLALTTNDGGSGGALSFASSGNVSFSSVSSILTINTSSYTLVNSVRSLAAAIANNPSGDFALAASYDAKQDGIYKAVPIPTTLTGTFEGLGNSIFHLKISDGNTKDLSVGLFAEVDAGGSLLDVHLPNSRVTTAAKYVGILVGTSAGTISGCSSGGVVIAEFAMGGGLVGHATGGSIEKSSSSAFMSSLYSVVLGGLIGESAGSVEFSSAMGKVTAGSHSIVGGLVGAMDSPGGISMSYATGSATAGAASWAGGLVGESATAVSNSYATGSVSVGRSVHQTRSGAGGLIGATEAGTLGTSYSTGSASGRSSAYIGGSIGSNDGDVSGTYWDTTTSGDTNAVGNGSGSGITGLTSKQLKSGLPSGFDPAIWGEQKGINHGFPYLLAIPPK